MEKAIKTKVEKLVKEINELLPMEISDGDALQVVIDKTCTVEYEESVKALRFAGSRLTLVVADWLGKERKEVFGANEMEYDAIPYLQMIKRAYKAAIKKQLN